MFQSLYRIQQYPDRRYGEAVLNWKGAIIMILVWISQQFIAEAVNIMIYFINANFNRNYGMVELNLFTDLATLGLLIFFFGRFYWENLRAFFKEFKGIYIGAPILCYMGAMFLNYIVQMILYMIRGSAESTSNNELVGDLLVQQPLTLILLTVGLAPMIEESIFRAGLFRPMSTSKNYFVKSLGYILSVFFFALMHVYQYAFFATDANGAVYLTFNANEFLSILVYIPMAIGFAVCAVFCKNFYGSVICHMITNGIAVTLMLLLSLLQNYALD